MPVNILNLPGLNVLDFKETDSEYHVRAEPVIISRLCPHCGRSNETVKHAQKTLFVRDLPAHGKAVANASLDAVPRSIGKTDQKKQGAGLKKAHKLFTKRTADLNDEQYNAGAVISTTPVHRKIRIAPAQVRARSLKGAEFGVVQFLAEARILSWRC